MKKALKKILLFFLLLIFVLLISEITLYEFYKKKFAEKFKIVNKILIELDTVDKNETAFEFDLYSKFRSFESTITPEERCVAGEQYKAPIIALFGCSFAVGSNIEFEESFQYKLANSLKAKIYNLGYGGGGVQHIYYKLTHDEYTAGMEEPKYVIYIFINDHISRQYRYQYWNIFKTDENLRYKRENNKYEKIKPIFTPLWSLYTTKSTQLLILNHKGNNHKKAFKDFIEIIKEENKLIKRKWPNSKFIILTYSFNKDEIYDFIHKADWKEITDEGIILVDTYELLNHKLKDEKYYTSDGYHPSGKAWDEITPAFIEFLKRNSI